MLIIGFSLPFGIHPPGEVDYGVFFQNGLERVLVVGLREVPPDGEKLCIVEGVGIEHAPEAHQTDVGYILETGGDKIVDEVVFLLTIGHQQFLHELGVFVSLAAGHYAIRPKLAGYFQVIFKPSHGVERVTKCLLEETVVQEEVAGIYPKASIFGKESKPQYIGEKGMGENALSVLFPDIVRQVHIFLQVIACKRYHGMLSRMLLDTAEAVLHHFGGVLKPLLPIYPNGGICTHVFSIPLLGRIVCILLHNMAILALQEGNQMAVLLKRRYPAGEIARMPLAVQDEAHFVPSRLKAEMPPQLEKGSNIVGV